MSRALGLSAIMTVCFAMCIAAAGSSNQIILQSALGSLITELEQLLNSLLASLHILSTTTTSTSTTTSMNTTTTMMATSTSLNTTSATTTSVNSTTSTTSTTSVATTSISYTAPIVCTKGNYLRLYESISCGNETLTLTGVGEGNVQYEIANATFDFYVGNDLLLQNASVLQNLTTPYWFNLSNGHPLEVYAYLVQYGYYPVNRGANLSFTYR